MEKTIQAIQFAEKIHRGQTRHGSGLPYIVHCFNVYSIVKEYKQDSKNMDDICATCILHDCLEDTTTTQDELRDMFGDIVANTVLELTNDRKEVERIGKQAHIDKKLMGLSNYALVIKLGDMLANLTDQPPPALIQRIAHHIEFLKANRVLTPSQNRIVNHIEDYLETV